MVTVYVRDTSPTMANLEAVRFTDAVAWDVVDNRLWVYANDDPDGLTSIAMFEYGQYVYVEDSDA